MTREQPSILFLCVHNAGRSQMAAAFARRDGEGQVVIHSAGSSPAEALNPAVVAAMLETDLDISSEQPQLLTEQMGLDADVIVTMGCGDACRVYPAKRYVDWEIGDPAGRPLEEVRSIRDDIERRVRALIKQVTAASTASTSH